MNGIFIVFGNKANSDLSNIKSLSTKVIPQVGDNIYFDKKHLTVTGRMINYSQVEDYDLGDPDRGSEMIYIFVETY
jgi:hypothetical protein